MSHPFYKMNQHEAMQRTWVRVTCEGEYVIGPITRVADAYDAWLVILQWDGKYIIWKHHFAPTDYLAFVNREAAVKYVADFISNLLAS